MGEEMREATAVPQTRRGGGGYGGIGGQECVPTEVKEGDFATICLQLSSSVLCGRTGGWWPPYFC